MNASDKADLLLINANVYTVSEKQPHAEAVAVKDRRIVFVGSNSDAKRRWGGTPSSRVVDLAGKTVVPGFTDAHCHIFGIGERELRLNLEATNTREDFLAKVKERVESERGAGFQPVGQTGVSPVAGKMPVAGKTPAVPTAATAAPRWVVGRGWIETFWKPPTFPTREELDKIAPDNPLFLTRADGHASVVNSAALKIAKIDKNTPDPFGGQILRTNGEPNGMLLDNAQELVEKEIPKPTQVEREQAFLTAVEREIKLGWCEIQNAGSHYTDVDLMRRQLEAGKVKLRVVNCIYGPGSEAQRFLQEGPIINAFDHHFTQRTIKVIFDGALGSRGAALLNPYSDRPETSGYLTEKPEELRPMLEEALRRGIQVETHAIGDRANRMIVDLYEAAFKAVPPEQRKVREPRWRVEHAQVVDPADIPRFAKLGVIPSMQPSHAISDLFFAPARLGMDRLAGAYAWQSFLKNGSIICGGSDAPVERGEPMIEFYAAVARKPLPERGLPVRAPSGVALGSLSENSRQNARSPHKPEAYVPPPLLEGWHPEQAVSREDTLKMFTLWPAFAAFEENDKGRIDIGMLADFTVLDRDIMKIPEAEILQTKCVMTIIGGEIVSDAR